MANDLLKGHGEEMGESSYSNMKNGSGSSGTNLQWFLFFHNWFIYPFLASANLPCVVSSCPTN